MTNGIFELAGGAKTFPGLRDAEFLETSAGQSSRLMPDRLPFRRYALADECELSGRRFVVGIVFRCGQLYGVELQYPTSDPQGRPGWLGWDEGRERAAAEDNVQWVKDIFGGCPCHFLWGDVEAGYDERGAVNYVNIAFAETEPHR